MKTRGEVISDSLEGRGSLRGDRRNRQNKKKDREGEVKIHYRHGQEYPPSIRADVDAKINAVKHLMKLYPITEIVLEPVKIDIVKLVSPTVEGKDYQNGPAKDIKADSRNQKHRLAILKRDGYKCLYCGDPVTEETACIHHFIQRKDGGSQRYGIQGTICERCHTSVATGNLALSFDLDKYPNIRAAGRAMHGRYLLEQELRKLGLPVTVKYGYETKELRDKFNVPKSHTNDAMVLACNPDKPLVDGATVYNIKLHARHNGRKLFYVNPGVAVYRNKANHQPGIDQSRMVVDDHDQATNKKNRSYRRYIRNKYYKMLRSTGQFNESLLPGVKRLNEVLTVNRAILLTDNSPLLIKNQRIRQWKFYEVWPDRHHAIERYDLVRTNKNDIGIVTSIMSNCSARVDFTEKREGYKTNFSFYKPETLAILQKASTQMWIETSRLSSLH
jgi:hypothetical protein